MPSKRIPLHECASLLMSVGARSVFFMLLVDTNGCISVAMVEKTMQERQHRTVDDGNGINFVSKNRSTAATFREGSESKLSRMVQDTEMNFFLLALICASYSIRDVSFSICRVVLTER